MATTPMSMVDAIAKVGLEEARSQTSITRVGVVQSEPYSNYTVDVVVGGAGINCSFLSAYWPVPGNIVEILVTRDQWLVLGPMDNAHGNGYVGSLRGTWQAGWGAGPYSMPFYRWWTHCWCRFSVTRTGAALSVNTTTGNIADNQMFQIDEPFMRSAFNGIGFHGRTGLGWFGDVFTTAAGGVWLSGITPGFGVINTGDEITAVLTYIGSPPTATSPYAQQLPALPPLTVEPHDPEARP